MKLNNIIMLISLVLASSIQFAQAVTPPEGLAEKIVRKLKKVCKENNGLQSALEAAILNYNKREHIDNNDSIWKRVQPTELTDTLANGSTHHVPLTIGEEDGGKTTCKTIGEYNPDTNRNMNWAAIRNGDTLRRYTLRHI